MREADKVQSRSLSLNILHEDRMILTYNSCPTSWNKRSALFSLLPYSTVPFKLQLRGKTKKNFDFERSSQSTVHPSHVVVRALYARNEFTVPKSGYEFTMFFVYNTGATELFDFKSQGYFQFQFPLFDITSPHPPARIVRRCSLSVSLQHLRLSPGLLRTCWWP